MRLSKALAKVEDNVKVQFLTESIVGAKDKKRTGDTEVTFSTQEVNTDELFGGGRKTAIIVWVDIDEFNQALKGDE